MKLACLAVVRIPLFTLALLQFSACNELTIDAAQKEQTVDGTDDSRDGSTDDGLPPPSVDGGDDGIDGSDVSDGTDGGTTVPPKPGIDLEPQPKRSDSKFNALWGEDGKSWSASGVLPDFSFAGYHQGEDPIPSPPVAVNVKTLGAKGDGSTDDSKAFLDAIASISSGVIFIPEGNYKLSKQLLIKKSGIILRGAGRSKTKLIFTKSLGDLFGLQKKSNGHTYWMTRGGLISVEGANDFEAFPVATKTSASAAKGARSITVSNASSIRKEDRIVIDAFPTKVTNVSGNTIQIERPLYKSFASGTNVHLFAPTVEEVGIEGMTLQMPDRKVAPHHEDPGFNGVNLQDVANCWVRDVHFQNADNGILFRPAHFSTVQDVSFDAYSGRGTYGGHHAISFSGSHASLATRFDFRYPYYHDITVENKAVQNVSSDGKGKNVNLDHHRDSPTANLFTNIDMGEANRPFASSGNSDSGAHSGEYSTIWNIYGKKNMSLPAKDFGPKLNFIAVQGVTSLPSGTDWYLDKTQPGQIWPPNIHRAQLAVRLGLNP